MIQLDNTLLRSPESSDLAFFKSIRNDLEIQFMLMSRARGSTDTQVLEWLKLRKTQSNFILLVIAQLPDNCPIGFIQLNNIDHISQHGELGIYLHNEAQGTQHSRNALSCFEDYILNTMHISKITLNVLSTNTRAINFYLKHHYRDIGYLAKHFYYDGKFHDVNLLEKLLTQR
jgi:RimJ/RimL family protein N-acetyltransferase